MLISQAFYAQFETLRYHLNHLSLRITQNKFQTPSTTPSHTLHAIFTQFGLFWLILSNFLHIGHLISFIPVVKLKDDIFTHIHKLFQPFLHTISQIMGCFTYFELTSINAIQPPEMALFQIIVLGLF